MSVTDASMLGAFANETEVGHAASVAWIAERQSMREPIRAPSIALPEAASAILRSGADAKTAVRQLADIRRLLTVHPVDEALAQRAAELVLLLGLRGCDAIYVALAERFDEELITLDKQQFERGGAIVRTAYP